MSRRAGKLALLDPQVGRKGSRGFRGPTARSNLNGGVLALLVRLTRVYDVPRARVPLQEITRFEHLVCEPILPSAAGIEDGEGAGQLLSFPLRLARWLRLESRRKGGAISCYT